MAADRQRFHQRILGMSQPGARMKLSGGQFEKWLESPVAVNPKRLVVLATVGQTPQAGRALLTIDVGFDAAAIARFD